MSDLYDRRVLPREELEPKVIAPGAEDMKLALETGEVCGECKYFELAHGQTLMQATKFVETLVREHEWKVKHLCSPLNDLGVCGQTMSGAPGEHATITGRLHKACDHFRRNQGLVSISRKTTDPR